MTHAEMLKQEKDALAHFLTKKVGDALWDHHHGYPKEIVLLGSRTAMKCSRDLAQKIIPKARGLTSNKIAYLVEHTDTGAIAACVYDDFGYIFDLIIE